MNNRCPICDLPDCNGYPYMWSEYAAGRNRDHWTRVHDRMNNPTPEIDDSALAAALIAQEYPQSVNPTGIPIGRKCC